MAASLNVYSHSHERRTSIDQLLNPVAHQRRLASPSSSHPDHNMAAPYEHSRYALHPSHPQAPREEQSGNSSFKLSAASWGSQDESERKKHEQQQLPPHPSPYPRSYHPPPTHSQVPQSLPPPPPSAATPVPVPYSDTSSRTPSSRHRDEHAYSRPPAVDSGPPAWSHNGPGDGAAYGAPPPSGVPTPYPDERSGGHGPPREVPPPQNPYPHHGHGPPHPPHPSSYGRHGHGHDVNGYGRPPSHPEPYHTLQGHTPSPHSAHGHSAAPHHPQHPPPNHHPSYTHQPPPQHQHQPHPSQSPHHPHSRPSSSHHPHAPAAPVQPPPHPHAHHAPPPHAHHSGHIAPPPPPPGHPQHPHPHQIPPPPQIHPQQQQQQQPPPQHHSQQHHPGPHVPPHVSVVPGPPPQAAMYPAPPGYYVAAYAAPPPGMYPQGPPPSGLPMPPGVLPPPPASMQGQKRSAQSDEDEDAAKRKAKRAKAPPSEASNSRRSSNHKKKQENAQMAAHNAQLQGNVQYRPLGPEHMRHPGPPDGTMKVLADAPPAGLIPELQFARCMSNRYKNEQFPRCVSCTRRWAGDTCRFQGIRFFLKDAKGTIVGVSFVENEKADAPSMNFPNMWNVRLEERHIRETKITVARSLLPILEKEYEHMTCPEIIRRPRESDVRATCDTCMTSIFSSSWMCRLCGREACFECFEKVRELTQPRQNASQHEIASLQARRESYARTNPFFLTCTRRNEHACKDFSAVSRFHKEELVETIKEMKALLEEVEGEEEKKAEAKAEEVKEVPSEADGGAVGGAGAGGDEMNTDSQAASSVEGASAELVSRQGGEAVSSGPAHSAPQDSVETTTACQPSTKPLLPAPVYDPDATPDDIPCHPTHRFTDSELTEEVFRAVWGQGLPLVVTDLLPKFELGWTPEYFIEKYGTQSCSIVECQTEAIKKINVAEFFKMFGKYEERQANNTNNPTTTNNNNNNKDNANGEVVPQTNGNGNANGRTKKNKEAVWKLKDWPPSTDFKTAFPELYEDFERAVPMPIYCRKDGALNIASHFPANTVAPDLGPKMYNALSTSEQPGSKGSTRLHMDMADAINIMLHAEKRPDGRPGVAAWDLFRAEDSEKLRKFLRKRVPNGSQPNNDPIHSQQVYLDREMRRELWEQVGVKSHRVYQRPGEAVFIPAGCAHQVANLADCIKVAIDFVSPENVARCEKLTEEFREQNQSMVWKEDVLQLRSMMWFAWLSCSRQESNN